MKVLAHYLIVLCLLLSAGSAQAKKQKTESYSDSTPLGDAETAELQLELGLAKLDLKAGESKTLIDINGRFLPDRSDPRLEVDRDGTKAYIFFTNDLRESYRDKNKIKDEEYYDVRLSDVPVYDIDLDIGLGDCAIDLDKLKIERLKFQAGLAESYVSMDTPNPIRARRVEIEAGLGELEALGIGNLRFDLLQVESGLGDVELDLRGFEGKGEVELSIGLGSCKVILPKSVGARVYYDDSFLSSSSFKGFDEVRNGVYETENFDSAESTLEIEASVGMGHLRITRRD